MAGEIVFVGIAPHPPLFVPSVGGARIEQVELSTKAMKKFAQRLISASPDTIVLISPHSPGDATRFCAYGAATLTGDFRRFGAAHTKFEFANDLPFLQALEEAATTYELQMARLTEGIALDHGVLVPMHFLVTAGWQGPLVSLTFTSLSREKHYQFGQACQTAVAKSGRRIAFIASADLSHYLTEDGPYHFEPQAHLFDEQICAAINSNRLEDIINIDDSLRERAGECGYRSIMVALGVIDGYEVQPELLAYEAPFGVGYLTAILSSSLHTS